MTGISTTPEFADIADETMVAAILRVVGRMIPCDLFSIRDKSPFQYWRANREVAIAAGTKKSSPNQRLVTLPVTDTHILSTVTNVQKPSPNT
jgi:hypothetical protein